ncbi:sulfate adenylyltransferase subunit 1 [Tepidibacter aestuarii]|uniref:sulfate adenylyltransferase subunit 1 n=1 Tax=Tepidibacter aestuarii TaxID=2925782 RepID=UPI0020BF4EB2|nr:GTP-binding protein [Tepidibacter aestuarii]CAH2214601.1 ATP-sulfurylase large subunit [Tepidibacter aestuarii]
MIREIDKQRERMNIVIVGHVDHGKSTIIGRLLADTGSLPEGKLEMVKERCKRNSKPFEYAFLLDALKDEQEQGITIDAARCFFKTDKRDYIIIDAPGHIEFLKNMITGASRAEVALLVIDANEGIKENSKRHGYLLSMLGIKKVAVLVNKMDLVDYKQDVFEGIVSNYRTFLKKIDVEPQCFVPVSGFFGDNIEVKSENTEWYKGDSVLELLDSFRTEDAEDDLPFRMPVQGVYKFTKDGDDRRIVAGSIDSGTLKVGDAVTFYPSGKKSRVKSIEGFNVEKKDSAKSGQATGFTLEEQIYIKRGEIVIRSVEVAPKYSERIKANIFWLGRHSLTTDKTYTFKIGTAKVQGQIEKIIKVMDASDLNIDEKAVVDRHDVAEVIIKTQKTVAFDLASELANTSRVVIVDEYEISGGGIIIDQLEAAPAAGQDNAGIIKLSNYERKISRETRAEKFNQKPTLVLLVSEQWDRVSKLCDAVEANLFLNGRQTYYLKAEHRLSLAEVVDWSKFLLDSGQIVIADAEEIGYDSREILEQVDNDTLIIDFDGNTEGIADLSLAIDMQSEEVVVREIARLLKKKGRIFNIG